MNGELHGILFKVPNARTIGCLVSFLFIKVYFRVELQELWLQQ